MTMSPFSNPRTPPKNKSLVPPPPRCECGGMFPLDRHPVTGRPCCATCYRAASVSKGDTPVVDSD